MLISRPYNFKNSLTGNTTKSNILYEITQTFSEINQTEKEIEIP